MQHGHMPASGDKIAATLIPAEGWHFLHLYYGVDRDRLAQLSKEERRKGRKQVARALTLDRPGAPEQMQCFAVPGHKGDLGFMAAGPDIHAIHGVQLAIQKSVLGRVLVPNYSFYSITEISEYVPSVDQYGEILKRDGLDSDSDMYKAKVAMYEKRLGPMNAQRLFPEFPDWPCMVFYPMSKTRLDGHNWYMLPFAERSEMMAQHGKSGMKFAGKVTQTITASTGLDDWEWGVTLWAKNPSYLKDIVYAMRFDEASAKYALFGEFRFGYILKPFNAARVVETMKKAAAKAKNPAAPT